jgi:hypothetical protein
LDLSIPGQLKKEKTRQKKERRESKRASMKKDKRIGGGDNNSCSNPTRPGFVVVNSSKSTAGTAVAEDKAPGAVVKSAPHPKLEKPVTANGVKKSSDGVRENKRQALNNKITLRLG